MEAISCQRLAFLACDYNQFYCLVVFDILWTNILFVCSSFLSNGNLNQFVCVLSSVWNNWPLNDFFVIFLQGVIRKKTVQSFHANGYSRVASEIPGKSFRLKQRAFEPQNLGDRGNTDHNPQVIFFYIIPKGWKGPAPSVPCHRINETHTTVTNPSLQFLYSIKVEIRN